MWQRKALDTRKMLDAITDRWADKTVIDRDNNVVTRYYYLGASAVDGVVVVKQNIRTTSIMSVEFV
jgi:hypothetical protein